MKIIDNNQRGEKVQAKSIDRVTSIQKKRRKVRYTKDNTIIEKKDTQKVTEREITTKKEMRVKETQSIMILAVNMDVIETTEDTMIGRCATTIEDRITISNQGMIIGETRETDVMKETVTVLTTIDPKKVGQTTNHR